VRFEPEVNERGSCALSHTPSRKGATSKAREGRGEGEGLLIRGTEGREGGREGTEINGKEMHPQSQGE